MRVPAHLIKQLRAFGRRPADWRPGIALQLGVALSAVAILAVAANLAVQHTTLITVTSTQPPTAPPPVALETPAPAPVTAPPEPLMVDGREALPALERLSQIVETAFTNAGNEQTRRGRAAAQELSEQIKSIYRPAQLQTRRTTEPGIAVLDLAARRHSIFAEYKTVLDRMDTRLQAAMDGAWKIMGRVIARQSLVALDRQFDEFRREADRLQSEQYDQIDIERWEVLATRMSQAIQSNERALQKSQGEAWYADTVEDLSRARALREQLMMNDTQRVERLGIFRSEAQRLRVQLRKAIAVPAPVTTNALPIVAPVVKQADSSTIVPGSETSMVTTQSERRGDGLTAEGFAWLTGGVLLLLLGVSAFTILSILRPVRRLVTATHRIAKGEASVRVERGGSKELDGLAVSFNDMAEQLEEAQATARGSHERLEARVRERTHQLRHQAEHDALTQLPNRRHLFNRLRDAIASADTTGGHIALFFLDLDNFKNINDGMGHTLGDSVLVAIARRLQQVVGTQGMAARFGGDEFTVVVDPLADPAALGSLGQALVTAFEAPLQLGDADLLVSISVGAATYPAHATDAEGLLRAADAAMFRAKALGRNQLCVFTAELLQAAAARFSTEQRLRLAIERGELELVFQPEINIATLEADLVETLLRWRLPDGRLASPDEFLAVAEESGLMRDISHWVLRSAIAAAARWRGNGLPDVRVSVNLSARDLSDPTLPQRIESMLQEHRLPADALEIELTETVLQTGPTILDAVRLLRQSGIAIALDDFGTGYSTLASLEQLPLTRVKLDRSLVAGVDSSSRSAAIASAIIALCRDLDLEITAEGVERPAQLAFLREYSLHVQGYLLSRPVSEALLGETLGMLPARLQAALLATDLPLGASASAAAPHAATEALGNQRSA